MEEGGREGGWTGCTDDKSSILWKVEIKGERFLNTCSKTLFRIPRTLYL